VDTPRPRSNDAIVLARAAQGGFRLVQYETDTGQQVREWQRGSEPRPQFVARRVAIHWMSEFLAREHGLGFVSNTGQSYW